MPEIGHVGVKEKLQKNEKSCKVSKMLPIVDTKYWITITFRSVSSPLMSDRTGMGLTKAQSMSALPALANINDLQISASNNVSIPSR